ncbi:MAG: AI-2E family transporter [Porcipelethomonas sp.]
MKIRFNAKHNTVAVYCIIVFTVCLALVALVFKYGTFIAYAKRLISVFSPIIWGVVIAYLLNPLMMFAEKQLRRVLCRKKERKKLVRALSICISFVILIGIVVMLVGSIVPELITSIENIFKSMPSYINNLRDYITNRASKLAEKNPELRSLINEEFDDIQNIALNFISRYEPAIQALLAKDGLIASITDSAWSFLVGLKDCIFGMVISVYLLFSKENFRAQATKTIYAVLPHKAGKRIFSVCSRFNYTFVNFLSGKAVDSLVIGIITFIGMHILKMDSYAVLISCLIGVTNMIPFFGPIIGAVPSGLLILLTDPHKTIVFIVFIILLQQFDGNILGPKILGNSLGLSTFWIVFSILIGGGLFGFMGMVAFVPLFAVLFSIIKEAVNAKLEKKKLPVSTAFYKDIDYRNPPAKAEDFSTFTKQKTDANAEIMNSKADEKCSAENKNHITEEKNDK